MEVETFCLWSHNGAIFGYRTHFRPQAEPFLLMYLSPIFFVFYFQPFSSSISLSIPLIFSLASTSCFRKIRYSTESQLAKDSVLFWAACGVHCGFAHHSRIRFVNFKEVVRRGRVCASDMLTRALYKNLTEEVKSVSFNWN